MLLLSVGHGQVRVVAASEISEPDWSRVTGNLNINAIGGGGAGTGGALPYVSVSLGKVCFFLRQLDAFAS